MLDKPSYDYVNGKVKKVDDKVGDTTTLKTTEKASVVGAVNELFTSVSNGKAKVASAITDKGVNTSQDATFDQMEANIRAIQTGSTGITPSGTKNITENGNYDIASFANVAVAVPQGVEVSGTMSITSNGEHDVSTYEKVNVAVPVPSGYIKPSGTKEISTNGTHDVTNYSSVEVDVQCFKCGGKGCNLCKGSGWIEVLGAGMVNNHVLEMCGYDPNEIQGFAFGLGIERITMLKHGIDDIRNFYTDDERFLEQF